MNSRFALFGTVGALVLAISGCDDGSSIIPQKITITGTAAMGAPIVGGEVRAQGANGRYSTIDFTGSDGEYSITAIGLTAPIIVRVKNGFYDSNPADLITTPTQAAETQVTMMPVAADGNANLTPLTTLAVQQAAGQSNVDTLFSGWETTRPDAAELAAAAATIRANLNPVANALVTDWATYDFLTEIFSVDQPGIDDVLDSVVCGATGDSTTFAVVCSAGITYNPDISTEGFESGNPGSGDFGTLTATNANPTSGNGTLTITEATATVDGVLTRIEATGTGFIVKVYYTTATGAVTNVSYFWGAEDPVTHLPENVAFCAGTCGATVNTTAGTATLTATALTSDSQSATLNGTISGF